MNRNFLTTARCLLILAGSVLCGGGILIMFAATAGIDIQIETFQGDGADTFLAVGFFTVAFVLATLVWTLNWTIRTDRPNIHEAETVETSPRVGSEFDRLVGKRFFSPRLTAAEREQIRTRLHEAAIRTVARTTNSAPDTARKQIQQGTWTDDAEAAAFLGTTDPPRNARLRQAIPGNWWFARGARQTARTIVRHADADNDSEFPR